MKRLLILVFVLSFVISAMAQTSELQLETGVSAHKEVDAIYMAFSNGYKSLKPEIVANLYSKDAAYLSPNEEITNGRAAILENFKKFFESVKSRGQTMTISFQILQRKIDREIGYDVGIYTINFFEDGKNINQAKGKFVVVATKARSGKWHFQVDGYSALKPNDKQ